MTKYALSHARADTAAGRVDAIRCIGDSHVCFFSGEDVIQPGWPERSTDRLPDFVSHHIGGVLAYNLTRTGSQTRGREQLFEILDQAVPAGGIVLLSFGEIDCRAHILKQSARRNLKTELVVAECLDQYFQVVQEVKTRGFEVIVYNVLPSAIGQARKSRRHDEYVAVGNWRERALAALKFNEGARERCQASGVKFLETSPALMNPNGRAIAWYYFDAIHLSQRAMPLTLKALAELLPGRHFPSLPLPAPTVPEQAVDLVLKRLRRWLKLRPPRRPTVYPGSVR